MLFLTVTGERCWERLPSETAQSPGCIPLPRELQSPGVPEGAERRDLGVVVLRRWEWAWRGRAWPRERHWDAGRSGQVPVLLVSWGCSPPQSLLIDPGDLGILDNSTRTLLIWGCGSFKGRGWECPTLDCSTPGRVPRGVFETRVTLRPFLSRFYPLPQHRLPRCASGPSGTGLEIGLSGGDRRVLVDPNRLERWPA